MTVLVNRHHQNDKGRRLGDFPSYFNELVRRAGYMKASDIVRQRFSIYVQIK